MVKNPIQYHCLLCKKDFIGHLSRKRKFCSREHAFEYLRMFDVSNKGRFKKGHLGRLGKRHSEETRRAIGLTGLGRIPWNKGNRISKEREREIKKNWQLRNPEYLKAQKIKRRGYGFISTKTIQLVYEDNIKQYGTLTCYLCLKPILFGKDTLEHKIPLVKGGTNEYNNLAIACRYCNCSKGSKTLEEYLSIMGLK